MYTKANHELVHLVTSEMANEQDRRLRRLFQGKVAPVAEHPESILYQYLTVPRIAAPRWYQEGSAVFMETWMGGGLGRAQGGYDEMVFRAMVRDDAQFYDPLGLVSKGTEVDFQVGANAYLYGTRFMSYLALVYSPEQLVAWWRRDDSSRRYYADDFERVFGLPLARAWQDWIAWEHEFQRKNLAAVAEHPLTPHHDVARSGLGAISRAYLAPDGDTLYAAVRYPGRVPHLVTISLQNGRVDEFAGDSWCAAVPGLLACLRSRRPGAVLHDRQLQLPQPAGARPEDARLAHARSRTRASATSSSIAWTSRSGACGQQRVRRARR